MNCTMTIMSSCTNTPASLQGQLTSTPVTSRNLCFQLAGVMLQNFYVWLKLVQAMYVKYYSSKYFHFWELQVCYNPNLDSWGWKKMPALPSTLSCSLSEFLVSISSESFCNQNRIANYHLRHPTCAEDWQGSVHDYSKLFQSERNCWQSAASDFVQNHSTEMVIYSCMGE